MLKRMNKKWNGNKHIDRHRQDVPCLKFGKFLVPFLLAGFEFRLMAL